MKMSFVIDNVPNVSLLNRDVGNLDSTQVNYTSINEKSVKRKSTKSSIQSKIESFSKFVGWEDDDETPAKKLTLDTDIDLKSGKIVGQKSQKDVVKEAMTNSIVKDLESMETLGVFKIGERKMAELKKIEKAKTKGANWYNLPATEMTEEIKNDLEILQMRSALDPKHFYKKNDMKVLPKYFQLGTVIDTPLDYYSTRGVKKNKKRTLVDELLADADFQKYQKKKYKEIIETHKTKGYYKANKKMKKLKKKK